MSEETRTGPRTEAGLQVASQNLDPTAWTQNPAAVQAIDLARRMRTTKHGLYASVPIICKSDQCPYKQSCFLHQMGAAPYGEKCPLEIAALEDLFHRYCKNLNIDPEKESNTVDVVMVKELVDIDVQILRCDNKMAIDADFIIENTVGVTEDGEAITKKELHPVVAYKEKLLNMKYKTLQLLNSTRKDKQGSKLTIQMDASERAAEMMRVQKDMKVVNDDEDEAERKYYESLNTNVIIDVEPIDYTETE